MSACAAAGLSAAGASQFAAAIIPPPAEPHPPIVSDEVLPEARHGDVTALMIRHGCAEREAWRGDHPGQIPAGGVDVPEFGVARYLTHADIGRLHDPYVIAWCTR